MGLLRNRHLLPKLRGLTRTTTGSACTNDIGAQEYSAKSRTGTGASSHTFLQKYRRNCVCVAAVGANVADGGYATLGTCDVSGVALSSLGTAGAGDDGTLHALILGWNNEYLYNTLPQEVRAYFHDGKIVRGRVTAAGTEGLGSGLYDVALSGVNTYTITFKPAFARVPVVIPTIIGATAGAYKIVSVTASRVVIETFNTSGTDTAIAFDFVAYGSASPNEIGLANADISIPGLKNEVIGGVINGSASTITIGSGDFTLVKNSTGDYTITFSRPFIDEPVVLLGGTSGRVQLKSTPLSTAFTAVGFNAGGVAADDTALHFLVFGSFDKIEI